MPSTTQARPQRSQPYAVGTNAAAGPSHKPRPVEQREPSGLPGISKIKASIRQTKRLLAKDAIEPGLRIATQRRLTSLQADLERAERREIEKKNGGKYHMVKFFERQKITRQIKRLRRQLSASPSDPKLDRELEDARIMLNYVINYPNEKKYISLFPSTGKVEIPVRRQDEAMAKLDKTERRRSEMLLEVRGMMERGEISRTPEDIGARRNREKVPIAREVARDLGSHGKMDKKEKPSPKAAAPDADEEDEFFESD